jgi:hypothetical protein
MSEVLTGSWIAGWVATVSKDRELSHIGKLSRFALQLSAGDRKARLVFNCGVFAVEPVDSERSMDLLEINGSVEAWHLLLKPIPDPLLNDVIAMDKNHPDFAIVSDRIFLLRHLRVVLKLFSVAPRLE